MKKIFTAALFAAALTFVATGAFAMDLAQARSQGLVGEKRDGYVAAVTPSPEASAIISDVNNRRRAEYEKIAKNNGQSVSVVGTVAAENIINSLPKGSYFQTPSGAWRKK